MGAKVFFYFSHQYEWNDGIVWTWKLEVKEKSFVYSKSIKTCENEDESKQK